MKFKQGYLFSLTTWENDGDNYQTQIVDGLTKAQAQFYVDLAIMHYSKNGYQKPVGFGNIYEPDEAEETEYLAVLKALGEKHIEALKSLDSEFKIELLDDGDYLQDLMYDVGLRSEFYTRVTDKFSVCFVPEEINLVDCTNNFN